jgi:type II secretory pathway pseudopilin PulG
MRKNIGFTMIEIMIAILFIGLAITALLASNTAFTQTNAAGIHISTAEFLIEEIREMMTSLPVIDPLLSETISSGTFGPEGEGSAEAYDDVDDFDGASFNPPIDYNRQPLNNFSNFTQQITVQSVSSGNLSSVQSDYSTSFVRVTVRILMDGNQISSCSWIRTR